MHRFQQINDQGCREYRATGQTDTPRPCVGSDPKQLRDPLDPYSIIMHWNDPVQPFHAVLAVGGSVFNLTHLHRAVIRSSITCTQKDGSSDYHNRFLTACGSARIDDASRKSTYAVAAESLPQAIDVSAFFIGMVWLRVRAS